MQTVLGIHKICIFTKAEKCSLSCALPAEYNVLCK